MSSLGTLGRRERTENMAGITSIGAYIPIYRLNRDEIAKMWLGRSAGGFKAVASYDEDAVTMAVASTLDCMRRGGGRVNGLYLATTTAPYKEKQSAAIVGTVADLPKECHTADFTNTLRSATAALKSAIDAVNSGSAENVIVTASDCRLGAAKGNLEQTLGDGAASLMIGSKNVIAEFEGSYSVFNDFIDYWRLSDEPFIQSAEGRFIDDVGYMPTMQDAISGLMKKCKITPSDISKAVFYASDARQHAALVRRLKLEKEQVQDPLYSQIGNTGTAAVLIMLAAALESAAPGDRIILAGYGDGSDAFLLRVTEAIKKAFKKPTLKDKLAKFRSIDYGKYISWRNLVSLEPPTLPERPPVSLQNRWRERRAISSLWGVKCKKCGTPQMSPIGQNLRVCTVCQAKDEFEDYLFSDKTGKLFSYAIDQLQPTGNPPGVNGVVDFDGGGRLICELTDYEVDKVKVGMPVEMTFRKMYESRGINNYFWKAKPITE
jgi:hydroxymethylglutaryl-CoA synthase